MATSLELFILDSDCPTVILTPVTDSDLGTGDYVSGSQGSTKEIVYKDLNNTVIRRKTMFYENATYPTFITKIINATS